MASYGCAGSASHFRNSLEGMMEMNKEIIETAQAGTDAAPRLMDFAEVMGMMLSHRDDDGETQPMFTRMEWPANKLIHNQPEERRIAECWTRHDFRCAETVRDYIPTYDDLMAGDWMEV